MDSVETRLLRSFSVIFPNLSEPELMNAGIANVEDWDSVATVTLINVVEEEFGIQIGFDQVEDRLSYRGFLDYLKQRNVSQPTQR